MKVIYRGFALGLGLAVMAAAYAANPSSAPAAKAVAHKPKAAPVKARLLTGRTPPLVATNPKAPALVTSTCSACHGLTGVSPLGEFPNLAGQGEPYLVKQIEDFRNHTRADPLAQSIMWGMAAMIPRNKIREIALYFASQKGAPGQPGSPKLVASGKKLYMGGVIASHLPACMACHGATGLGLEPWFPRLAGQHQAYVIAQLQAFKNHTRANDPHAIMRTIAGKLSTAQMTALAAYVHSL
ncbi:c-type cytochrome [Acidiferrobacter sp.]|uniref:c-type cytochrome n=1 Tax=Acidiferrobacter sp. TaxID=1872107 RepID=UPI00262200BE|nr:c-type cytochrome [Acidiferrobacter sp.]